MYLCRLKGKFIRMKTLFFKSEKLTGFPATHPETGPVAATVGFFDGVHLGHRFLIGQMKEIAAETGLPSAVVTFPEHPRKVLDTRYCPELLNSFEEKLQHLEDTGIDYCFVTDFTKELSQLSAQAFMQKILAEKLSVRELIAGYDHRFGKDRTAGIEEYTVYGEKAGIRVSQAQSLQVSGNYVSSTRIRNLILSGDMAYASQLLSYRYKMEGIVISGNQLGRKLGFPTANIKTNPDHKILPSIGIYAVWVYVNNAKYKGMLYIGHRPTIENNHELRIEVHLLDFSGNLYNQKLTLEFVDFLHHDEKFDSLEALQKQLAADKKQTAEVLIEN